MNAKNVLVLGLALALLSWTACAPSGKTSYTGQPGSGQTSLPMGAIYHVDNVNPCAADTNPGTQAKPWKTIARAGTAKELKPGDTVLIHSGVYREHATITVSGSPDKPITFAAAPNAKVVIKGSEIVTGKWERMADTKEVMTAYHVPMTSIWRTKLGEEFFTDKDFAGCYNDKSKRWVSQVFYQDSHPLQMIGPDGVYKNNGPDKMIMMLNIGKGLDDMIPQSFFFNPADGYLYAYIGGIPDWYVIEVGVRGFILTCDKVHDVIVRGLEMRHNRQPGGQWSAVSVGQSQRVLVEDCRVEWADFDGLSVGSSKNCVVRHCDLSNNGCMGMALGVTEDCTVEYCSFMRNDYRKFYGTWGVAAGSKNIPGNKRATFRHCEFAYNDGPGLWFDTDNSDIRILDNVVHHNLDCGIFFEINRKGGGLIAGNLVYANGGRGIYMGGSENTTVVNNTLADNDCGIVFMPYDDPNGTTAGSKCFNNLLIHNYIAGATITRGNDLTLEMKPGPAWQETHHSQSDYNVFANNSWTPTMRPEWNTDHTMAKWREIYHLDYHSTLMPVDYRRLSDGFELLTLKDLPAACPLPKEVTDKWTPPTNGKVGSAITKWPCK